MKSCGFIWKKLLLIKYISFYQIIRYYILLTSISSRLTFSRDYTKTTFRKRLFEEVNTLIRKEANWTCYKFESCYKLEWLIKSLNLPSDHQIHHDISTALKVFYQIAQYQHFAKDDWKRKHIDTGRTQVDVFPNITRLMRYIIHGLLLVETISHQNYMASTNLLD